MYSRETFLVVPDTNVSHPDVPGLAASSLQWTPRRVVVNCCMLSSARMWQIGLEFAAMRLGVDGSKLAANPGLSRRDTFV